MINRFIADIKKYYKYAFYSARASLKAEVQGSYLNWIWWILNPVFEMLVYWIVFGIIFGRVEEYYVAFLFIGIAIWNFFSRNTKQSVRLIKSNSSIVSKIYVPKFILVLSQMFVNTFKMGICFSIVAFLILILRVSVSLVALYFIPVLLILLMFTFGIMCILTHFGVYVEDLNNLIDVVLKFVFYLSGVMYSISKRMGINYPKASALLEKGNPIAFLITSTRECLLYSAIPSRKILLIWFLFSLALDVLGIMFLYKNENNYAKLIG